LCIEYFHQLVLNARFWFGTGCCVFTIICHESPWLRLLDAAHGTSADKNGVSFTLQPRSRMGV
jgi:hypothetical protein